MKKTKRRMIHIDIFSQVDSFLKKAVENIPQKRRKDKIKLYCEGLKAKANQVKFALDQLKTFENKTDANVSSTDPNQIPISSIVEFYCDCFWTFLYSCLDILAQVENQALNFVLVEKKVDFYEIKDYMKKNHQGNPVQMAFDNCVKSPAFKNLSRYRNCSIHRRQIYFKEDTRVIKHPNGYLTSTRANETTVVRILCDNPLDINPCTKQERKVPVYLEKTCEKIF